MLPSPISEKEDQMSGPKSKVVVVHVTGPLAPFAAAFESMLTERGFTPLTRVRHLQVMLHLSRWLLARQLDVAGLSDQRVEQYLGERRAAGYTAYCSRTSLSPLWELLALRGAPLGASPEVAVSQVEVLLAGYSRFLREERALASSTTAAYVVRARRFLAEGVGEHGLGGLGAADVVGAVLRESAALSVGSTQFFVVALRAFLRYCYVVGLVETDLSAEVCLTKCTSSGL
jgi:integrase/recombinase XerD